MSTSDQHIKFLEIQDSVPDCLAAQRLFHRAVTQFNLGNLLLLPSEDIKQPCWEIRAFDHNFGHNRDTWPIFLAPDENRPSGWTATTLTEQDSDFLEVEVCQTLSGGLVEIVQAWIAAHVNWMLAELFSSEFEARRPQLEEAT